MVIDRLAAREDVSPPIHLTTGIATSLRALAQQSLDIAGGTSRIIEAPARSFDVAGFCGDPARAMDLLGWGAQVDLRAGLGRLAGDLRRDGPLPPVLIPDPSADAAGFAARAG